MLSDTIRHRPPGRIDRGVHLTSTRHVFAWLTPETIVLDATLRDRRQVLAFAATSIGRRHQLDPAPIFRALWRREQAGSTAFGCGIAIPHARIFGLAHPVTLFLRATPAIDFRAPDGKGVDSILVMAVPADGSADDHLTLLALLASMLSERAFRLRLSTAADAAGIRKCFANWGEDGPMVPKARPDESAAGERLGSKWPDGRRGVRRRSLFARRTDVMVAG